MSDSPENFTGGKNLLEHLYGRKPCRVAYTLNNGQPVACTIIGDQPMFYMDFEEDYEEESFFDAEELAVLEREVSKLKKEIDDFERFAQSFEDAEDKKIYDLFENANTLCSSDTTTDFNDINKASLKQNLIQILSKSRIGKEYLDIAAHYNIDIKISTQIENAFYDRKSGEILINPAHDFESSVLLLTRELRRHWQHRQGALVNPLFFQPDNAILINRIQTADLTTSIIRVAWELQLSGYKKIWERVENSSMADLARAFAHEAFMDFRTINNGIASTAAFEAWFLSERCKIEDKELIQHMLSDYQGYVFDGTKETQSLTAELIAALGTMPFGKNYLAMHAPTIMNDPIFTDVRDRSNANFLWFIKFERSFRETEQGLQKGNPSSNHSPHSGLSPNRFTGDSDALAQTGQIISFKPQQNNAAKQTDKGLLDAENTIISQQKTRGNFTSDENIVHLRHWQSDQ
ncbi:MAG: DUF6782 family putative metallopeptidase [Alphaproteobacteria bacterium]